MEKELAHRECTCNEPGSRDRIHPALTDGAHCLCGLAWPCEEALRELAQVKAAFATQCHTMLDGRGASFVIGPQTFAAAIWREPENTPAYYHGRVVSAAAIRLILDWASNDFAMTLPEFISGMFLGRAWDKKTPPWKLIPEAKDRISAESLGFDHLYPKS